MQRSICFGKLISYRWLDRMPLWVLLMVVYHRRHAWLLSEIRTFYDECVESWIRVAVKIRCLVEKMHYRDSYWGSVKLWCWSGNFCSSLAKPLTMHLLALLMRGSWFFNPICNHWNVILVPHGVHFGENLRIYVIKLLQLVVQLKIQEVLWELNGLGRDYHSFVTAILTKRIQPNELSTVLYNYKALMETLHASNGGTSQVAFIARKNARFRNGGRGKSVIGIENIFLKKGIENRNTLIFHM